MKLRLYHTGACRHLEYATRRGAALRPISYPMHAGVIERKGDLIVFDPGYAPRMLDATQHLPERLYRWMTPLDIRPEQALVSQLDRDGGNKAVSLVILSHFHADHVAGLRDFPDCPILCSRAGWDHFRARSGFPAVRAGYLRSLVPADFADRARFVEDLKLRTLPVSMRPFTQGWDLFGDGSIILLALPGHAAGHIGALFGGEDGSLRLMIGDASWSVPALLANDPPPWLTLKLLGSTADYLETWSRLRELHRGCYGLRLHACHCSLSSQEVLTGEGPSAGRPVPEHPA